MHKSIIAAREFAMLVVLTAADYRAARITSIPAHDRNRLIELRLSLTGDLPARLHLMYLEVLQIPVQKEVHA